VPAKYKSGPSGRKLLEAQDVDVKSAEIISAAGIKPVRPRTRAYERKYFIFWDGEATRDVGYCLFGNSEGLYLQSDTELSTVQCLELILYSGRSHPDGSNVAFAFDYDVNNILRDLPWTKLCILHTTGKVSYLGYWIEHIPHKIFKVAKDDVRVKIDDVFSYFRQRFDRALKKYGVIDQQTLDQISAGKDDRPNFTYEKIDEIRAYWLLELEYGVKLMDKLKRDIYAAGMHITSWHGPGALAAFALGQNHMRDHKYPEAYPAELLYAIRCAYAGGWFERFKAGLYLGPVYSADINSAYVYAMSLLPSMATGQWFHIEGEKDYARLLHKRMACFRVRWVKSARAYKAACHGIPMPLFHRDDRNGMSHPTATEGWYWSHEVRTVFELGDQDLEILEAWIFADDGTYPFEWVGDMYQERLALQAENNPAEKALKWALASMYGRVAQRAGWNRREHTAPKWHQLEWAGNITSICRSMIFGAALDVGKRGGLISIDTDGILSSVPFGPLPNGEGNQLGRWKVDEYSGIIYIQNGVYWLRDMSGTWIPPKTRGIPAGQIDDPEIAIQALRSDGVITLQKHNFIGYGAAARGRRKDWRKWLDSEHRIDVSHGGSRQHSKRMCRSCRAGIGMHEGLHDLASVPRRTLESYPHRLPWLEDVDMLEKIMADQKLSLDEM